MRCTTLATPSARRAGFWRLWRPTARSWRWSRAQATRLEDNLNPVGRLYYAGSTMICTPVSLAEEVGLALGGQAGPARLEAVLREAGFGRVRIAAETPFNIVLEARR